MTLLIAKKQIKIGNLIVEVSKIFGLQEDIVTVVCC